MILVDTNVWSELLKPIRDEAVVDWLRGQAEQLVLSSIVLGELDLFVAKQDEGRRKRHMRATLDALIADSEARFVSFGREEAAAYGQLMARLRRAGKPIPLIDGWIAAQALAHDLTIATRNTGDFVSTGVKLIDPWQA